MSEAEMYPLVDNATYITKYDTFEELKSDVEMTPEGLNMIQSWYTSSLVHEEKYGDDPVFGLVIFMPRKGQTSQFETANFDRVEVQEWLNGYVRERVMRWYGWEEENE